MLEVELHVISEQRSGLLIGLSQVLISNGFSLAKQRLEDKDDGVHLMLIVRGPESGIPALQRNIADHNLVRSVEIVSTGAVGGAMRTQAAPASATAAIPSVAPATTAPATDRVEALLPKVARAYPNIMPMLLAFERELAPEQRESTLYHAGERVGAWVYKRDYALGGQLPLADTVRRIAQPALRQLVNAEAQEAAIRVSDSPFCNRGEPGACCHFLRGMLMGLVSNSKGAGRIRVIESACRNIGADACTFTLQEG